jgi:hypothetical protein
VIPTAARDFVLALGRSRATFGRVGNMATRALEISFIVFNLTSWICFLVLMAH